MTGDLRTLGISSHDRVVDGTWITPLANATLVLVPLLILLGILAGIGVIALCLKATGSNARSCSGEPRA